MASLFFRRSLGAPNTRLSQTDREINIDNDRQGSRGNFTLQSISTPSIELDEFSFCEDPRNGSPSAVETR